MVEPASPVDVNNAEVRQRGKNFSELETHENHEIMPLDSLKSEIKGSRKQHNWEEITAAVNSGGVDNPPEFCGKKWA